MALGSEDSAPRAADSASSDDEDESEEDKESEEEEEEEEDGEEEEELGDEADNSSESGTDKSEVGRASSSGGSDAESESEDDEVSDTDQEEVPERRSHAPEADVPSPPAPDPCLRPRPTRSVFLKTTTAKSSTQPGERTDCSVPSDFPQKPMIEMQVNSNIWYQAYVFKESANEVKVRFPGFGRAKTDKIEWLRKSSCRIWTGSYKAGDWKHLGKGAWEPRCKPGGSRQAARSGSAGAPAGSAGRARGGQLKRFRDENTASATPELTSQAGSEDDDLDLKDSGNHSPTSKGKRGLGRKGQLREEHEGLGHVATVRRQASGAGVEEEVVSPRPIHTSASRGPGSKGAPQQLQPQQQAGCDSQQRHSQQQQLPRREEQVGRRPPQPPAGDEHHSEGEHYWSAHSPNVAESPGVFADQNSSRSSLDLAGGTNPLVHDPDHDPLRKWFEVHFQKLHTAGKLSSLPFGMCESGVLPDGFVLGTPESVVAAAACSKAEASQPLVVKPGVAAAACSKAEASQPLVVKPGVAAATCSKAEASQSLVVKPGPGVHVKSTPGPSPAALHGPSRASGSQQQQQQQQQQLQPLQLPKKKRPREAAADQQDCSPPDGSKAGGVKRPVKLMVKQVPPQPVAPCPAASVEESPVPGSGLPSPVSGFWASRDAALGQGPPKSKHKESKEGKGGRAPVQQQQQQQQQQQGLLHGRHAASTGPAAATTPAPVPAAAAAATVAAPAASAAPPAPVVKEAVVAAAAGSDVVAPAQKAAAPPCSLPHKLVSKQASKDRLGRRVVLSESSDEEEDRVSPRPAAPAAAAAPAPAAPLAQPGAASAVAAASAAAAHARSSSAAHASSGSLHPGSAAAPPPPSAGASCVKEEPWSKAARPASAAAGAGRDGAPGPGAALGVAASAPGQGHRSQHAAEGCRAGGAEHGPGGRGASGSEGVDGRSSEAGVHPPEGSRARGAAGAGPGSSRPSSPVAGGGTSVFKLGQHVGGRPEPDRGKGAPVLTTDDLDF